MSAPVPKLKESGKLGPGGHNVKQNLKHVPTFDVKQYFGQS